MLQNGIAKNTKNQFRQKKFCQNLLQPLFQSHLDNLMKNFHHRPQEHLTDTRLVPIERKRADLPSYYESEALKPPEFALHLNKTGKFCGQILITMECGLWAFPVSALIVLFWTAGLWTSKSKL